jgi:tRNA (guanine-N7-)-methyltransferase
MRIRTHTNPLNFYLREKPLDLSVVFPSFNGTLDVECGFGLGGFVQQYSDRHMDRSIVGFEIRTAAVELLRSRLSESQKQRIHLHHGSAEIGISDMLPDASIDRVFAFHPDPWFKKRHNNRRLIKPSFVAILEQKMKVGGRLYLSTDVPELWESMVESLAGTSFVSAQDDVFWKEDYFTPWHVYSVRDQRTMHCGVWER